MQALPGHRGGADIVARALQLIPDDSHEAGSLWSRYVHLKGMEDGDYEGATDAFDRTLEIANRFGDVALEVRTLAQSSMVDFWHLRWQGGVEKGLRVIGLVSRAEDPLSDFVARRWPGIMLWVRGGSGGGRPNAQAAMV